MSDRESFYSKLKTKLEETTTFPTKYLFKFIVPSNGNQVEEVKDLFNQGGAVINTKKSRTGKYISVSIHIIMNSSEEIIEYYKKAEKIEGIISL
jgi:putative lipoic acid-binding regulatory protein